MVGTCRRLGVRLVFKASWDKANRSAVDSFRGPGISEGLDILREVRSTYHVPVVTDVHAVEQVGLVADVADVIQIPAFLCRQTDLIRAASEAGRPLLIKKMQMMAPESVVHILEKCARFGADELMICERGTSFGYTNLVVDPLSFPKLKALGVPIVFDVTHALQQPGGGATTSGRGVYTEPLAIAGVTGDRSAVCRVSPYTILGPVRWSERLPLGAVQRSLSGYAPSLVKSWGEACVRSYSSVGSANNSVIGVAIHLRSRHSGRTWSICGVAYGSADNCGEVVVHESSRPVVLSYSIVPRLR